MISRVKLIRIPFVKYYHSNIIDHYETPRNVGSLPKNDKDVGIGLVGSPSCGDVVKLSIRVNKDTKTITEAYFKTFGCGSAVASSSYTTEIIKGVSLEKASLITNSSIAKHLNLPPVKLHCSLLAEDAIKAAINDYEKKQLS